MDGIDNRRPQLTKTKVDTCTKKKVKSSKMAFIGHAQYDLLNN